MIFHIYQDVRGEWRWYLAAPNGAKLALSAEGYTRRGDCVLAIKRVQQSAGTQMVYDNFGPFGSASNTTSAGAFATALAR